METIIKSLRTLNFGLALLLILLFSFSFYIHLPGLTVILGRVHPMLLHFPIGIFFIYVLLVFLHQSSIQSTGNQSLELLLQSTLLTALLSAVSGLCLASEGQNEESNHLLWHKYSGVVFAVALYGFSLFHEKLSKLLKNGLLLLLTVVLILTGHYGAEMTHGENFLIPRRNSYNALNVADPEASVYTNVIQPILQTKCFSCHNDSKSNGQLNMKDSLSLIKGGKSGPAMMAGNADGSHIYQRMMLPNHDQQHMPPAGKSQLSPLEAKLIELWIKNGAHYHKNIKAIQSDTLFYQMVKPLYDQINAKSYAFKSAPEATIKKLNSAYRKVYPLYKNSPALVVTYLLSSGFSASDLQELNTIKAQIIELNLNNMPVEDEALSVIGNMENLETLFLNNTKITSKGVKKLTNNKNLKQLALSNTLTDKEISQILPKLQSIQKIYLTNTRISKEEINKIRSTFPKLEVIHEDYSDIITQLTPPFIENTEPVVENGSTAVLKHYINGASIKYTLDDTEPDSVTSPVYTQPLPVKAYLNIKAKAYKEGWIGSDSKNFLIYTKGIKPAKGQILTKVNERYKGEGFNTLINSKLGPIGNLPNPNWLGFQDDPFEAIFDFEKPQKISTLILSYGLSIPQHVFPPVEVRVYTGENAQNLKVVKNVKLPVFSNDNKDQVKNDKIIIPLDGKTHTYYKVFAQNLRVLPPWHPGKGSKAWVFVDEIFFYE